MTAIKELVLEMFRELKQLITRVNITSLWTLQWIMCQMIPYLKITLNLAIVYVAHCITVTSSKMSKEEETSGSKRLNVGSDFAPGAATCRTQRNIRVISDSAHSLYCVKTWRHPQNRKYIHNTIMALLLEKDRATAKSNTYRKFGENWTCAFWDMRADRQRDKQTDMHTRTMLITIVRIPTGDEAIPAICLCIHGGCCCETARTNNGVDGSCWRVC